MRQNYTSERLPAGMIVKIDGLPFILPDDTRVMGVKENFKLIREYLNDSHRVSGNTQDSSKSTDCQDYEEHYEIKNDEAHNCCNQNDYFSQGGIAKGVVYPVPCIPFLHHNGLSKLVKFWRWKIKLTNCNCKPKIFYKNKISEVMEFVDNA